MKTNYRTAIYVITSKITKKKKEEISTIVTRNNTIVVTALHETSLAREADKAHDKIVDALLTLGKN